MNLGDSSKAPHAPCADNHEQRHDLHRGNAQNGQPVPNYGDSRTEGSCSSSNFTTLTAPPTTAQLQQQRQHGQQPHAPPPTSAEIQERLQYHQRRQQHPEDSISQFLPLNSEPHFNTDVSANNDACSIDSHSNGNRRSLHSRSVSHHNLAFHHTRSDSAASGEIPYDMHHSRNIRDRKTHV